MKTLSSWNPNFWKQRNNPLKWKPTKVRSDCSPFLHELDVVRVGGRVIPQDHPFLWDEIQSIKSDAHLNIVYGYFGGNSSFWKENIVIRTTIRFEISRVITDGSQPFLVLARTSSPRL